MRSSDEFKNEVYLRAKAEKDRIKRRKKLILTVIPCIAIVIMLGVYGISNYRVPATDSVIQQTEGTTVQEGTCEEETEEVPERAEDLTQSVTQAVQMTQSAQKESADNSYEAALLVSEIFKLNPKNDISEEAVVINSLQELEQFLKNNSQLGFSEEVIKITGYYNESFFKEQSLVIVVSKFIKDENKACPEILVDLNSNSLNINIEAKKSNKKDDAKIMFIQLLNEKIKSDAKINVSFS